MPCAPDPMRARGDTAGMQAEFARSLLWHTDVLPAGIRGRASVAPLKRFTVYRNNVFASLTATLSSRFPAVERLVGSAFFSAMARVFIAESPPLSPVLLEYGAELPAFLETFAPVRDLPYLPDVARLEWLYATAYHAADADSIGPDCLEGLAPEQILGARFALHPAAAALSSPYPVVTIWEANVTDAAPLPMGPDIGAEDALVARRGLDVAVMRLGPGAYDLVSALGQGCRLEDAAGMAMKASADFNLYRALGALFSSGAVAAVNVPMEATSNPRHSIGEVPCTT